jgi:hypothetical protein
VGGLDHTGSAGEAAPHVRQEIGGGDYFMALRIPLVSGRRFTDRDTAEVRLSLSSIGSWSVATSKDATRSGRRSEGADPIRRR